MTKCGRSLPQVANDRICWWQVPAILLLFFLLAPTSVLGQQNQLMIEGRIEGPALFAAPVVLTLTNRGTGAQIQTTLAPNGNFSIAVAPGVYDAEIRQAGFAVTRIQNVSVAVGAQTISLPSGRIIISARDLSQPPPPKSTPVYNAVFDGALSARPIRLADSKRVSIRFFLGPTDEKNGLADGKWTINPAILNQPGKVDLTVSMYCDLCSKNRFQKDAITFDSQLGRSTEAHFEIEPVRNRTSGGIGKIVFDVSNKGQEFDNIWIEVVVGDGTPEIGSPAKEWDPPSPDMRNVDLVMTADLDPSGEVQFTFRLCARIRREARFMRLSGKRRIRSW